MSNVTMQVKLSPTQAGKLLQKSMKLEKEVAEQAAELEAFKHFTDEMLSISWQGGDAGGDTIQELAEKHGLIKAVTRTERCDDEYCACAEISDFPLTCYRKTYIDQESRS
ncbi:hypothetical protein [Marinobacterium lutimaris]|uniref:Uncharacterized protein n=1 Tax=Marinobacterium lutimaris TaxID=568106 RepID=A0A1H5XQ21_9GAMM|nr:hypothetical protein [Marinobacterium lutimaris]SEG13859.1 hypothetical protein SAMN05444390_1011463 [Marinobacterium lutimaris]